MEDGKGAYSIIEFLGLDASNIGIGFCLTPPGIQSHQQKSISVAIKELYQSVAGTYLTKSEAKEALY